MRCKKHSTTGSSQLQHKLARIYGTQIHRFMCAVEVLLQDEFAAQIVEIQNRCALLHKFWLRADAHFLLQFS